MLVHGPSLKGVAALGKGVAFPTRGEDGAPATIDVDFLMQRYWWGASLHQFSDFTITAGSPSVTSRGLLLASGDRVRIPAAASVSLNRGTILIEWDGDAENTSGGGFIFSAHANNSNHLSVGIIGSTHSSSTYRRGGYFSGQAPAGAYADNNVSNSGLHTGIGRLVTSYAAGRKAIAAAMGGPAGDVSATVQGTASASPSLLTLGYRSLDTSAFVGAIRRVRYWSADYSSAWVEQQASIAPTSLHILGDSFVTSTSILPWVQSLSTQFRVMSTDGVGGSSLTAQASRYAASSAAVKAKTLAVLDGGLDTDAAASIAAIDAIVAAAGHGRWCYVQSSPAENVIGSPGYTNWAAVDAAIRAHVGESHYVYTLARAQMLGNGSGNDNTDIANGIWPRSLRDDSIHPTPTAWASVIGYQIAGWLAAYGR